MQELSRQLPIVFRLTAISLIVTIIWLLSSILDIIVWSDYMTPGQMVYPQGLFVFRVIVVR